MEKFKVGDKVTYHRGKAAERVGLSPTVSAVVDTVSLSEGVTKYEEPLYHISWLPGGEAFIRESQLS